MPFSDDKPGFPTSLCLACSSSLPPKSSSDIFTTPCCRRPICSNCLSSNPRLRRYNPCLSCLGGVGVINAGLSRDLRNADVNVDGAVRDEDTFILGDDDDEVDASDADDGKSGGIETPPPAYPSSSPPSRSSAEPMSEPTSSVDKDMDAHTDSIQEGGPQKYHIARGDTLQGISFRFGVNGRELCRLNNLPPSTLTTTPHLLHTRVSLVLPPDTRPTKGGPPKLDQNTGARGVRQRAEKRMQLVTKEADWRVAKAYVALADDPDEEVACHIKCKEVGTLTAGQNSLEYRAVDHYLEDQEWEEEQRRQGRVLNANLPSIARRVVA
ncbi:hypothetical protein BV22DRAFT_1083679 [Leucogyrophana mollusca]|uniref:Uncharacterized protein n=1 Tax=Leucogyrophana mollusca TaxID=85980 RepID=A0ACB8BQ83_9AGAM|nr:hypothetical protein BV22DRAFT_1083679 [Leucogyrophana mollusca]